MKIVSWNVNSIHSRLERLLRWLDRHRPEVLCLQETKVVDDKFPLAAIVAAGYHVCFAGQKAYNGVAILSTDALQPLPIAPPAQDPQPAQARLIAAKTHQIHVMSVYVPNGQALDSPKWAYKLAWLAQLQALIEQHFTTDMPLAIAGDYNIAPTDADVAQPQRWAQTVLCCPQIRARWQALLEWGLIDALPAVHPQRGIFSWWDYRRLGFVKNDGLRIDHLLLTKPLAHRLLDAGVDREERKGVKPSDHAPAWATFGAA